MQLKISRSDVTLLSGRGLARAHIPPSPLIGLQIKDPTRHSLKCDARGKSLERDQNQVGWALWFVSHDKGVHLQWGRNIPLLIASTSNSLHLAFVLFLNTGCGQSPTRRISPSLPYFFGWWSPPVFVSGVVTCRITRLKLFSTAPFLKYLFKEKLKPLRHSNNRRKYKNTLKLTIITQLTFQWNHTLITLKNIHFLWDYY